MKVVDSGLEVLSALRAQPERGRFLLFFAGTGVAFFALDWVVGTFFLSALGTLIVTTLLLAVFAAALVVLTAGLIVPEGQRASEQEKRRSLALARATNVRLMKGEREEMNVAQAHVATRTVASTLHDLARG